MELEEIRIKQRYKIEKVLGQGGFGVTYLAYDEELCQEVVLKKYRWEHGSLDNEVINKRDYYKKQRKAFLNEARILSSLFDIKEVVKVFDYFEERENAYIVMEFVQGISLRQYLESRNQTMSFTEAWNYLLHVMEALEKVHQNKLIHRDISPDNFIIKEDGSIKLLDFGSAREYAEEKTMTVLVKKGYAPPEQYSRKGKQGPWTDIYSICATLYEMITGVIPQPAMERLKADKLYLPSSYGCDITPLQEKILMKGLALDYKKRYKDIAELKNSFFPEKQERQKKNKKYGILICTVCILLLTGAILGKQNHDKKEALAEAKKQLTLGEYARDSKEHKKLLNLLVKYGKYKGKQEEEKIYELPQSSVLNINKQCDIYVFEKYKEEYLSYIRKEGFQLKLKDKKYRGDVYMEPCGGTLSTYFTYKETYAIGQNTYIQLVYDIATHKISKVVVYRKDENQNKKRMIEAASRSFLFLSDDWNCPIKVTKRKVKRIVKKNEEDIKNKNGHYYRWIGVSDCNIGCDRNEENGIFMQIDNYDYK